MELEKSECIGNFSSDLGFHWAGNAETEKFLKLLMGKKVLILRLRIYYMAMGAGKEIIDTTAMDFLAVATEHPAILSLMLDLNGRKPMDRGAYVAAFTSRYNKANEPHISREYVDGVIGILVDKGVFGTTPTVNGEDVYVNGGQQPLFNVLGIYDVSGGRVVKKPNGHQMPRSQIPTFGQE